MTSLDKPLYLELESIGQVVKDPLPVTLSPELIVLLSDQLYRSPAKAIEELVVNGYDAEASEARVFVPQPGAEEQFVAVYDDGIGMTYDGLVDLWKIGREKNRDETLLQRKNRKQIGKFGIGKLATYVLANRITYLTKSAGEYFGVTLDYGQFHSNRETRTQEVQLPVHQFTSGHNLATAARFQSATASLGIDSSKLDSQQSWTIVLLEDLKEKARTMSLARLTWVLRTALPIGSHFKLLVNGSEIESSKEDYERIVDFRVADLPEDQLKSLQRYTGEEWYSENGQLFAPSFPSGISGDVAVTRRTLQGKSNDLGRSNGFFVYIRNRLINEEDALFGLHTLQHQTWNRFICRVYADDLDHVLKASRETIGDGDMYDKIQGVLNVIFNEARSIYEAWERDQVSREKHEEKQNWVPERFVEHPTADALTQYSLTHQGSDADGSWMYLDIDAGADVKEIAAALYSSEGRKAPYIYRYVSTGRAGRLVTFDPMTSVFAINEEHELVLAYQDNPVAQDLLRDFVTSEALLEIYLREAQVDASVIGDVLEKRDMLLRGLADSHMYSLPALGQYLRNSASDAKHLEIALVAGARALGFVAKHLGGQGEPDGIARFRFFPGGVQTITLEAKSSAATPSAKDINFAAIQKHMQEHGASGCLLVAPNYPGGTDSNVAVASKNAQVSCWTVERLAAVIASAESRQIAARDILKIVQNAFAPIDVSEAVDSLLADPSWERRNLYLAITTALRATDNILQDTPRSIPMIATFIAGMENFQDIQGEDVASAVRELAAASKGALRVRNENEELVLNVDYDELDRRVQNLTGNAATPRRAGAFGALAGPYQNDDD